MNLRGNPDTLVPNHPGNQNALKAGVFSPNALAARVQEVEAAIAERPIDEVLRDVLRREVAALAVLGEAMDRSLADTGVRGRHGQPPRMIDHRLRLNEKLRRTLDRYEKTFDPTRNAAAAALEGGSLGDDDRTHRSLAERIVDWHMRAAGESVTPGEFDPEVFLRAVVLTEDSSTTLKDVMRARKLLIRRRKNQPPTCTCTSTLRARDAIELREWIDEGRETGADPAPGDAYLAATVRTIGRGDVDQDRFPYALYRRTIDAIGALVEAASEPECADATTGNHAGSEGDPLAMRFWRILLSTDPKVMTKDRLDAFAALDEMEALPRCSCNPQPDIQLAEYQADETRAFVIRVVAQHHYRAALVIARYPETYLAVRDLTDQAILARTADEVPGSSDPAIAAS